MRNRGQTKCLRCRRPYHGCRQSECIDDETWSDLVAFAKRNGRTWKSKLRRIWGGNDNAATLRRIRNILGPSGLDTVKLEARRYQLPNR